jgi:hypothetical protein
MVVLTMAGVPNEDDEVFDRRPWPPQPAITNTDANARSDVDIQSQLRRLIFPPENRFVAARKTGKEKPDYYDWAELQQLAIGRRDRTSRTFPFACIQCLRWAWGEVLGRTAYAAFLLGTLAPFLRASERPIAMASLPSWTRRI